MEEWRDVPGFPNYAVSSLGSVRHVGHHHGMVDRILKPDYEPHRKTSYPRITAWIDRRPVRVQVHRLVALAFIGPRPAGKEVNHKDGNKGNPSADNLEYVTRSENERHKYDTLQCKINQGERHGMSKLSDTQVQTIRGLIPTMTRTSIARQFNVSVPTVSMIANGRTWRHLLTE